MPIQCTLYRSIHLIDGVKLNDMVKQMVILLERTGVVLYYLFNAVNAVSHRTSLFAFFV